MKTSNSDKSPQESPWIPAKENNSEPDELEPHIETDTSGFTILSEYLVEVIVAYVMKWLRQVYSDCGAVLLKPYRKFWGNSPAIS